MKIMRKIYNKNKIFIAVLFCFISLHLTSNSYAVKESKIIIDEHSFLEKRCVSDDITREDVDWACGLSNGCGFGQYPCSPLCMTFSDGCSVCFFVQECYRQVNL